jgi:probable HAF family extracellular repeat protein
MKAAVVAAVALFCVTSPAVADNYSFTTLGFPGANHTYVEGINDRGQIVGGYTGSHIQGFLYSGGTYTLLDLPPLAIASSADGINNAGQIVGYYVDGGVHGFLYRSGVYTTLNDPLV